MSNGINILVVGNGYDLANGLKTRFSDYMKPILKHYVFSYLKDEFKDLQSNENLKNVLRIFEDYFNSENDGCTTEIKNDENYIQMDNSFFDNEFIKILLHKFCPTITILRAYIESLNAHEIPAQYLDDFKSFCEEFFDSLKGKPTSIELNWLDVENIVKEIVNGTVKSELHLVFDQQTENKFYGLLLNSTLSSKILFSKQDFTEINFIECKEGLDLFSESFTEYLKIEEGKYTTRTENNKRDVLVTGRNVALLRFHF